MSVKIKIQGIEAARGAIDRVLRAQNSRGVINNFNRVVRFALDEVKARTPVDTGRLRAGWVSSQRIRETKDGFIMRAKIVNNRADTRVFRRNPITGAYKLQRQADDSPLLWRQVIAFLDRGTRPHKIFPRRYGYLLIPFRRPGRNAITGRFQKRLLVRRINAPDFVAHPGTKPYGMVTKTRELMQRLAFAAQDTQVEAMVTAWENDFVKVDNLTDGSDRLRILLNAAAQRRNNK